MNALARSFQCVCRRRYLTWLLDLSCLRNRRVTDVAGGKCWRTDLVNSSNPRPQGQGVTICLGLRTRVRFRVPPSRDKWPKPWTLGQNRGHLFGLRSGIELFSVQFPGEFMPSWHARWRCRLWLRIWLSGCFGLRRPTDSAVVLLPFPEGLQREADAANQGQMWKSLLLTRRPRRRNR